MTPVPWKRRFAVPTLAIVALSTPIAAAQAAVHSPVRAPGPGEDELRKRLDALNTEAEKLTERYNKTRVELGKAKQAEQAAAKAAATLQAQAAPARTELGRLAAANYMTGSPDMLFGAGDATGLSASAYLVQSRAAAVNGLQAQIDAANRARNAAAARTAQVRQAAAQAETARQAAKAKVDEVTRQLDKLTTTTAKDPKTGLSATVKGSGLPAKMARKALGKLGSPYVWAAAGPNSFDCSGLVVWAYGKVGKPGLPHYTGDLYGQGRKVSKGELRSGDLVYFGGSLHHMGIYLSDGKYLHAPRTGDVVKISKMSDRSDFAGANRIE
ncbi:C40 family peptidase [Actinomadura rugatobispora]|uniref:C40 family peptidase n=1 Tax=Actinomadura rugatobispora TaxID=1994 RepID=A0ABW1AJE2_9ACTN|nr:C40 family peptidase [Actinomadura rugatobispora]